MAWDEAVAAVVQTQLSYRSCARLDAERAFSGVWKYGFEESIIRIKNVGGDIWLDADGPSARAILETAGIDADVESASVAIDLVGRLSERGHFGHLGSADRVLVVERVISARAMQ